MALDPVVLDDLTWNDFSTAALLRIPAASGGRWTLNAPVDPGITLVDLFGWLLEQRVYWMDQVSDPLTRALLSLMGITPNPAVAATTVLHLCLPTDPTQPPVELKTGVQAQLAKSLDPPVFTTKDSITVYPFVIPPGSGRYRMPRVDLTVGASCRTNDLNQGRSPALLDPNGGDTTITLHLDPKALPPESGTLSLFVDLLSPPGVDPGWSPSLFVDLSSPPGVDPDCSPSLSTTQPAGPNPLTWLISINKGTPTALAKVQDGTNGLRRSGIVLFPIPDGWTPQPNTTDYAIILRASAAGWTTPPRVTRLIPNVVSAVHSRPLTSGAAQNILDQVTTWRRLPGNVIILPETDRPAFANTLPDETRPALANTLKVTITEAGQPGNEWKLVDDLGLYGPDDPVYVYDAASARLRFGDGVAGRLPIPTEPKAVIVTYRVGGGEAGNLASGLQWSVDNAGAGTLKAWNVVAAAGGLDAETLDQVRQRAPEVLKSTGRAITAADFEEIATQTPGTTVARAVAGVGRHPCFPSQLVPGAVTVFLVPDVPRDTDLSPLYGTTGMWPSGPVLVADQPTIAAVLAALDAAKMVATEVYVTSANYRPVSLGLTITAAPTDKNGMKTSLYEALQKYFDPLIGGDENNGWPFGGPIRPSTLLRIAQTTIGPAGTVNLVTITLDGDTADAQGCTDVNIGPTDLVVLTEVDVIFQAPAAGQGGLQ
jgi:Baseplate J-like protein